MLSDMTLEEFIETYIEDMEQGRFDLVYTLAYTALPSVAAITSLMYKIDVDPLQYINYIPRDFYARFNIKTFEIPNNIKNIQRNAFGMSAIKTIHIPAGVKDIAASAFLGCYDLVKVTFDDNSQLKELGAGAFQDCIELTQIELPESLEVIHRSAFYGCDVLRKVTLKSGLKVISTEAFTYCPNLEEIIYDGTSEQWQEIDIAGTAFDEKQHGTLIIKCTDKDIRLK